MDQAKLIRTSRIIDRVLRVLQGFLIAGGIVSAVFIPLVLIFGTRMLAPADGTLQLGALELQLTDLSYFDLTHFKGLITAMLLLTLAVCAVCWYGVHVLRSIFRPLKEGQPFRQGISGQVRRMAWVTLIGGAVYEIGRAAVSVCALQLYDLSAILDPAAVSGITYRMDINAGFLILAVILFLLSYVFSCGEVLQKESDETL